MTYFSFQRNIPIRILRWSSLASWSAPSYLNVFKALQVNGRTDEIHGPGIMHHGLDSNVFSGEEGTERSYRWKRSNYFHRRKT